MLSLKSLVFFGATAAFAEVFKVDVGKDKLKISPDNVKAAKGDTVIFTLYPEHDLAEGNFDQPCLPKNFGIYSGQYKDTDGGKKKFVMTVNSTDPIYFYCTVPKHCNLGMVAGINLPDGDKSLQAYTDGAKNAKDTRRPAVVNGGQLLEDAAIAIATTAVPVDASTAAPTGAAPTGAPTDSPPFPIGNSTTMAPSGSGNPVPEPTNTGEPTSSGDLPPPLIPSQTSDPNGATPTPSPSSAAVAVLANMGMAAVMGLAAFAL